MKLHRRVIIPTLLLAGIVATALAYFAWDSLQRARALQRGAIQVQTATALAFALDDAVQEEDRWVASVRVGLGPTHRARIEAATERVARLLDRLDRIGLTQRAAHTLTQFREARSTIATVRAGVISAADRGDRAALRLELEKWQLLSVRADALLKDLGAYYLRSLDRTVSEVERRSTRALAIAGAGVGVGTLLALLFALLIARTVVRPLESFAATAHAIAVTGVQSKVSGADREDEIGTLARAFNEMTGRLLEANERLEEADRRKNEFLGMLSHELRNPLAPIRNSSWVLRQAAPGSEQARRAQAVIERQTEHLTRLVDDLLDVTRIARGKIELRTAPVDLREVISQAADDFRPVLAGRGVEFRLHPADAVIQAEADATRVTQIVGNLLHNASKFTPSGGAVTLTLRRAEPDWAEISVADTGAGIDESLLPTIFEPFTQGEPTLARTDGGLGLGLALVKGIAELHGGSVHARSAGRGRGAEFVVRLPLTRRS